MDYNNVWILRVMCLNLSLSCFIKQHPEKFYHFFCDKYVEHWRLYAENKIVLDILPERYKPYLTTYFCKYPKEEREKVKYFVSDMWRTYYDTAGIWFKNAIRIVDKYHWIRQVIWAFENVRKEEQKKFSKTHRRYFKNSKKLLLKRFNKLENEQQVLVMLEASVNLSRSHWYKGKFPWNTWLQRPWNRQRKNARMDL